MQRAVSDPTFGIKNAFILEHYFSYPVHRELDPNAWVPPGPRPVSQGEVSPAASDTTGARTFDELCRISASESAVPAFEVAVGAHAIRLTGCSADERARVKAIIAAVPLWARDYLCTVRQICVTSFDAFRGLNGEVSTATSGVAEPCSGRLLLNRAWLDRATRALPPDASEPSRNEARQKDALQWENTLLHELGHFHDRFLKAQEVPPSLAPESPLGNHGVWYTNYAWWVQDPAEDLAEGYALLAQERLHVLCGGVSQQGAVQEQGALLLRGSLPQQGALLQSSG